MQGSRKRLIVCADDYGLSPAISQGIGELARTGRITAFSCITNADHWPLAAAQLTTLPASVSVGLHFNLTEGRGLTDLPGLGRDGRLPGFGALLLRGALRRLPQAALAAELDAQWQAFEKVAGHAPAFVDSHQHVHVLPQVGDAVLRRLTPRAGLRNLAPARGASDAWLKRAAFMVLGSYRLRAAIRRSGCPYNRMFAGIQTFSPTYDVRTAWRAMLGMIVDGSLIAAHVAATPDPADPIGAYRLLEMAYLAGEDYPRDLAEFGVEPVPFDAVALTGI